MGRRPIAQMREDDEQDDTPLAIQDTQEFRDAVQAAVRDAIPDLTAKITSALQAAGSASRGDDPSFIEGLAVALTGLTDQSKQIVHPKLLRQRAEARDRMMQLIVDARAQGAIPIYELRNKVYLDEQIVEPIFIDPGSKKQCATQIEWQLVPNEAMVPVNDVAKAIYAAFQESNGNLERDNFERPLMGVTAGGLVIRSGSSSVRPAQAIRGDDPASAPRAEPEGGLRVAHKDRPGQYVERRVLGTVAAPARQTV